MSAQGRLERVLHTGSRHLWQAWHSGFLKFMTIQAKHSEIRAICRLSMMLLTLLVGLLPSVAIAEQGASLQDRERFSRAWQAASRGERDVFLQLMPTL